MKKEIKFFVTLAVIVGLLSFGFNTASAQRVDDEVTKALNKFQEEKGNFEKIKEFFGIKNADNREDSNVIEKTKALLERTIDVLDTQNKQLEKNVKVRADAYGEFSPDILQGVKENSLMFEDFKVQINAATSTDALKEIAKNIKDYRTLHSDDMRKLVIIAHINQFQKTVIDVAQDRSNKLEQKIKAIKDLNKETIQLEELLTQAQSKIDQAKKILDKIGKSVGSASSGSLNLSDVQNQLNIAKDLIKDCYQIFRQLALRGNEIFSGNDENQSIIQNP